MALRVWRAWRKKQATISDEHEHRESKSVNIFLGSFFLVNCSLGSGFLATPYSFFARGLPGRHPNVAGDRICDLDPRLVGAGGHGKGTGSVGVVVL